MVDQERVEALAEDVRAVEATRDGIRRELDGCQELLTALETAVDGPLEEADTTEAAATAEESASTPESDPETAESDRADTPKSEAAEGDDNTESEDSDIIVA